MENEREVLLEVNHLNVTYGSGKKAYEAVQDANFKIYKGETFGLVGESGSGKTTIGRAILRILPTSGGEILYKGQKIPPAGQADHQRDPDDLSGPAVLAERARQGELHRGRRPAERPA